MRINRRLVLWMIVPGLVLGLWLMLGSGVLWATLDPAQRAAIAGAGGPLIETHGMIVVFLWLLASGLGAWVVRRFYDRHIVAVERLASSTHALIGDPAASDVVPAGGSAVYALAEAINGLANQRRLLQRDMDQQIEAASRRVAEQRDQLAALMAELNQSVVVCNLEGRILLYNEHARQLFRAPSRSSGRVAGAEVIGLGRSIHAVVDKSHIAHALETIERNIAGGRGPASISARFVTSTGDGHLLRVNIAPVRGKALEKSSITGFVLLLDDITINYEADSRRDREFLEFTEANRASLANAQTALELLEYPDLDAEGRDRFYTVVRDEVVAMGTRISTFAAVTSQEMMTRWPLQDMSGMDLLTAMQRRIAADHGQRPILELPDDSLWLSVDSFALIDAASFLAGCLVAEAEQPDLRMRLTSAAGHARFDLVWSGADVSPETANTWQNAPMRTGGGNSLLNLRDIAERHGGEVWIQQDHERHHAFFRFLLPLARSGSLEAPETSGPRPEYYDFDLFGESETNGILADRLLSEIAYTVFDTETTGLDPAGGDEILQIGATRIVNGRLLRGEWFDQIVDPGRSIPEASSQIHGISAEHVRGKPSIGTTLPVFQAFVSDTVLVGHNVAFDMRFLKLKEASTGICFDQPVLDTLLLSSVAFPEETTHSLEALAGRLSLRISDRHSALGDALCTAEVFLKLLPLLRQRGVLTLAQARAASQSSYYARLRY